MKNSLFMILLVLSLLSGCANSGFQYAIVSKDEPVYSSLPSGQRHSFAPTWQIDSESEQFGTFHVKYHPSYNAKHCIVVEGSIGGSKNGFDPSTSLRAGELTTRKYPIVLDTGASQGVFVNDIHVLENNLRCFPVQTNKAEGRDYGLGRCFIPQLRVGRMTLKDFPCWYLQRHLELKFFGLPVARDDSIIVGLTALREFSFVVFDGVGKEAEFSLDGVFEPDQEQAWSKFPLSIEEDHGNAFLFVQIPVAGQLMKVQLDTGSGSGLSLNDELWEKLSQKEPRLIGVTLKEGTELYPYVGRLPCKKAVAQLQVGDRLVSNAKMSVFPAESPLLSDCDVILGMQYFQDTVIALDFKKAILWVRK